MMALVYHSDFVFTDSGGLQKEAFFLNKKCITLRDTTEWVETIDCNANMLAMDNNGDINTNEIMSFLSNSLTVNEKNRPYGDGQAAVKILNCLKK